MMALNDVRERGELRLGYGGGGYSAAGTSQIDSDKVTPTLLEVAAKISSDGQTGGG